MGNTIENRIKVRYWIVENMVKYDYDSPFDLAVDCAYDLGLCEMCEINGDNTLIPEYIVEIAATFLPE